MGSRPRFLAFLRVRGVLFDHAGRRDDRFRSHLAKAGELARRTQAAGFSGMLFTETGRTAYLSVAVASQAAPGLELSTGVAVAFPRSPFVTAAAAWEMQEATNGKFRLGLGTQVRTHVVRRYGMEFERPGPRMRDYVRAVKACFGAFRTGNLDHHGEFYALDFITPQWSAGPIDAPDPKVDVAAVNPWMLRMAGEVADGVHVHPLGEPGTARHVLPNVAEGAAKSGRSASDIAVIVPVMTIVGDTDEERHNERELVRTSMSFYGSTPNYAFIWDQAGFRGHHRADPREAEGRRLHGDGGADHRRAHRDVRDRVDVGWLGRRADRQVRRDRDAHRVLQRARRSGALRAVRRGGPSAVGGVTRIARNGPRTYRVSADAMPVCPKSSPFHNSGSRVSSASA